MGKGHSLKICFFVCVAVCIYTYVLCICLYLYVHVVYVSVCGSRFLYVYLFVPGLGASIRDVRHLSSSSHAGSTDDNKSPDVGEPQPAPQTTL